MRLRAAIACFLDIFRVCLRRDWIGNHPRERLHVGAPVRRDGSRGAEAMKRLRAQYGLLLPSGLEAEKLGLVFNGEIPAGWKPIKERRAEAEKAKVKAKRDALKAEIKRRKETPTRTHNPPARSSA